MAGFLFAGRLTGRREFFLLFFLLVFVALYSLCLNLWTVFSFSFVQEVSEPVAVKGSVPRLKIGIYNDKPFPFTKMRIRVDTVMLSERNLLSFNLSPRSHIYFDLPLHCAYRGVYGVGMTALEVNDIFGLLKNRFDLRSLPYYRQRTVKIYPRLTALPYLPARQPDAKYAGRSAGRASEEGETYADLRKYRPGDPMKRVHRVASARRGELYVKTYDIPIETAAMIALDNRLGGETGEEALYLADLACECAAAVAYYCLRAGYVVDLVEAGPGRPAIKGRSRQDFPKLYDALAVMPFRVEGDLGAALERESRSARNLRAVYVISGRPAEEFADPLNRLSREGCAVRLIAVSAGGDAVQDTSGLPGVRCISLSVGGSVEAALGELL